MKQKRVQALVNHLMHRASCFPHARRAGAEGCRRALGTRQMPVGNGEQWGPEFPGAQSKHRAQCLPHCHMTAPPGCAGLGEGTVGLPWPLKSLSRRQEAPNRSPAAIPRAGDGSSQHPSELVLPTLPRAAGPSAFSCFPSGWRFCMLGTPHSGGPEPPSFLST